MRSVTPMKMAKTGYIVMSVLFCLLGAALLLLPDVSVLWIGRLLGVAGIVLVFRPDVGVRVLTALMGLSLLTDGALNLSVALCTVKIVDHQQPDVIKTDDYEIGKDE